MLKSQEMKAQLTRLTNESKDLMNKEGVTVEEINAKQSEIALLKAKIATMEQIEAEERQMNESSTANVVVAGTGAADPKDAYVQAFVNAITGKEVTSEQREMLTKFKNALSSGTSADGGYLIPVDQQVQIKELMRELKSLADLVNIETVNTLTGSRNIEKDAEHTPFGLLTEGGTIQETDSPQFVNIEYAIKTYAGILPVPNNLMADAAVLLPYLNKWLAKKAIATRNYLIRTALATLDKTAIADIDDIKDVLNVTLDPAISDMSVIIMNQDSFNKFDQMKDSDGKPLLQPMVTDPTKLVLAGKQIRVYSNKTLKTRDDNGTKKAPVIIGNLKEAVTLFDRNAMSLLSTNIGAGAFETNTTKFRAIDRLDLQKVDTAAVVFGEIVVG